MAGRVSRAISAPLCSRDAETESAPCRIILVWKPNVCAAPADEFIRLVARMQVHRHREKLSPVVKNKKPEAVMPIIKIHLEYAEYDAVERFASGLNVKPEAVAYCALNRLMLDAHNPALRTEIAHTWEGHHK